MVRNLPTGVVTLLFTDVEGSTRLLHELGDDYGEALHEHRRRLRAVFADHEGIELAASWVSMLSCAEIAEEIERNIDFLATSIRDVPERHRSLRAAFDQSWRLLSGDQQDVLARLSVLRGDYGREAAVAVAGADLRLLSELVSKSLVRRSDFGRFELHELLRQYAAQRLAASPGEERDAHERHARHYAAMLMERQAALMGQELAVARDELRGELDNLRAAAEWILAEDDEHVALPVLEAFYTFLWMHSWFDGAETLGRRPAGAEPGARARRLPVRAGHHGGVSGRLPRGGGVPRRGGADRESDRRRAHRERGLDGSRFRPTPPGRPRSGARGVRGCARPLREAGQPASACVRHEQARAPRRCRGALRRRDAPAHGGERVVHRSRRRRWRRLRVEPRQPQRLRNGGLRGGAAAWSGRVRGVQRGQPQVGTIASLCRVGFATLALDDFDEARRTFRTALERARASAAISLEMLALSGVGAVLRATGEPEQAATVLTFALGHQQLPPSYSIAARPALAALEAELPPEQLAAARLAAAEASVEDLIAQALEPVA